MAFYTGPFMIQFKKPVLSYTLLTAIMAAYFALVLNIPTYSILNEIFSNLEQVKIGFIVTIPLLFFAVFNFLFSIFSWPWFTKPFFTFLTIASALVSYAAYNYGIIFDADMITNIIETDTSEAGSYISIYSMIWLVILGIVPAVGIMTIELQKPTSLLKFITSKLLSMLVSLIMLAIIAALYFQDYASVGRNNSYLRQVIIPTYFVYSGVKYVNKTFLSKPIEYKEMGVDAQRIISSKSEKPDLVVFVVGETARAQNYQLNGYDRNTNPYTSALNVVAFQDVTSCGTATAISVPCMFSEMGRSEYDSVIAKNQDNLLDILKRAEIDVLWIENDGGDKGVASNVNKIDLERNSEHELCNSRSCLDMALLENFEDNVEQMKGNRMVYLHLMGSHGPTYFERYSQDFAQFQPECNRADIENCTIDQIVNSYDNSILYTDHVLATLIEKLKHLESQYNTALFYVSDHGESLGESGLFLHGMPYSLAPDFQKKVPLLVWGSDSFKRAKSIERNCVADIAANNAYSHDNIFHTVLGLMDISTSIYQSDLDMFAPCRT